MRIGVYQNETFVFFKPTEGLIDRSGDIRHTSNVYTLMRVPIRTRTHEARVQTTRYCQYLRLHVSTLYGICQPVLSLCITTLSRDISTINTLKFNESLRMFRDRVVCIIWFGQYWMRSSDTHGQSRARLQGDYPLFMVLERKKKKKSSRPFDVLDVLEKW